MKKIHLIWILIWTIGSGFIKAQDSLTTQILNPHTYEFSIIDGKLVGEGAEFLMDEINKAQFTLLGDIPHSKNCADLTTALIPILDKANYKTIALGIGPVSNQVFRKFNHQPKEFIRQHRLINDKYSFAENGTTYTPFLEMRYVEEANYYAEALKHNWSVIGIGRESWNALPMLIDLMYENLTKDLQQKHKALYEECLLSLQKIYKNRNGDLNKFYHEVKSSKSIDKFLTILSKEKKNVEILLEFKYCLHFSLMYAQKVYFKKNKTRVQNEKDKLKQQADILNFDWAKDKMFVKWDHGYIPKGIQTNPVYGLGNSIHELASIHGNQSLHIGVLKRFYMKDGVLYDELESDNQWTNKHNNFIQMGQKSKWVIIDVKSLLEGLYYYPIKYLANKRIENMISGYDLIIIPKTEYESTPNFKQK